MRIFRRGMKAHVWISNPEVRRQLGQAHVPARYLILLVGVSSPSWVVMDEGADRRRYHFSWEGLVTTSEGVLMYGRRRSG
jgi:hypothetical protein